MKPNQAMNGVSRLIMLGSLAGLLSRASADALRSSSEPGLRRGTVELVCVDDKATGYGTFQSHNQKVVSNKHGIFMTHIRTRNKNYTAQMWRLMRSTDGGKTFSVVHQDTHATNPPVLETDEEGNIYLVRVDFQDGNAYLYRFLSALNLRHPRITAIPGGAAGKYAMRYDPTRKQLYFFSHNNTFHVVGLDGKVRKRVQLLRPGKNAVLQYPLLDMTPDGVLHAAWTTQQHGVYMYWDIHHMLSRDGGDTWQDFSGTKFAMPVIADDTGPATRITWDDEFEYHSWLSSFRVKSGKLHFVYLAQRKPARQHYMRYDMATHRRDVDRQPRFRGESIVLSGLDGFFASRSDHPRSPLYCVLQDDGHIACLASDDNGETWYDYAKSKEKFRTYSIGGCREVTDGGDIIGSFTDVGDGARPPKVYFFRIRARGNADGAVNKQLQRSPTSGASESSRVTSMDHDWGVEVSLTSVMGKC